MKLYLSLLCTLLLSGCSMTRNEKYADYVNPVIGTDIQRHARGDKAPSEEKGQTMPAVGVPNGMTLMMNILLMLKVTIKVLPVA